MGPHAIFAALDAIRQGEPALGTVAVILAVSLGLVACQGLLMGLVRYLSSFRGKSGPDGSFEIEVITKDDAGSGTERKPPPESPAPPAGS